MNRRRKPTGDDVVEITSAPTNRGDEIDGRERRYLVSMAIRTGCFLGAVLTFHISWILSVLMLLASFLLPVIAVVVANSANPRKKGSPTDPGFHHGELGPGESDSR